MSQILSIISNLVFIAPGTRALFYGHFTRSIIYFLIVFTSGSYHACDANASWCLFDFSFHRQLDFFFAELIIPLSALYLIYWGRWSGVERFLIIGFAVALAILLYELPTSDFVVQGVMVVTALLIVAIYWIGYAAAGGKKFPTYSLPELLLFVSLATTSIVMFSVQNYIFWSYDVIHSLWHCMAALGQFYLLAAKPPSNNLASPLDAHLLVHKRL